MEAIHHISDTVSFTNVMFSPPGAVIVFEIIGYDLVECPPDTWIFPNSNVNGLNLLVSTWAMAPLRHREDGSADGASPRHHGSIVFEPKVSLSLSNFLSVRRGRRERKRASEGDGETEREAEKQRDGERKREKGREGERKKER